MSNNLNNCWHNNINHAIIHLLSNHLSPMTFRKRCANLALLNFMMELYSLLWLISLVGFTHTGMELTSPTEQDDENTTLASRPYILPTCTLHQH